MQTTDLETWRAREDNREVRGLVWEIRQGTSSWYDVVGLKLRVERYGDVYLTKLRRSNADVAERSAAFLEDLEVHGWTANAETGT